MLVLEGGAFAWKEDFARRVDAEFFRVTALIDGDANAAARILIEKRIADGHVHEGFAERKDEGFAIELEADLVADGIAERAEIIALHVGDERAEGIVEADDVAGDSFFFDRGSFRREANELGYLWAGDGVIPPSGEMRGGGRKNIAAMKRGRNGGSEHPGGVGDFVGGVEAIAIECRSDEAVVGQDKVLSFFRFDDDGFARSADAGIDDAKKNGASGIVGSNGGKESGAFFDLERRDLMGDVHDANVGRNVQDDGFAESDGVVGGAEVGDEDDGGTRSRGSGIGLRRLRAGRDEERDCEACGNEQRATAHREIPLID